MSVQPFVPKDFDIPTRVINDRFVLRPITIHDVVKDYDAVMTSVEHLKDVFGPEYNWPAYTLTLEQNLIDLGWHQKEFQRRRSFTYTVVNHDETRCLGCVYILPSEESDFDADVYLWVRASETITGLDSKLFGFVFNWIRVNWPFRRVRYPYRDISEFEKLD